jgi:hypothetical protein
MRSCNKRKSLFVRCQEEIMHYGDHRNGMQTWPRMGKDLYDYLDEMQAKWEREHVANDLRLADERRKAALRLAQEAELRMSKAALRLAQEAELRMSAATCREGGAETTPGVTHARWDLIAHGEDRRADRTRSWMSYACEKCKATRVELTEWDDL